MNTAHNIQVFTKLFLVLTTSVTIFIIMFSLTSQAQIKSFVNTVIELNSTQANFLSKSTDDSPWIWLKGPTKSDFHVLVRSLAYYDDRTAVACLRFYWIYSTGTPKSVWKNLRFNVSNVKGTKMEKELILDNYTVTQHNSISRKFSGWEYNQFMTTLPLNSVSGVPEQISIISTHFNLKNVTLSVHIPATDNKIPIAVCVKPSYGKIPDDKIPFLIEWIEINKLFGVSEFHFYNSSLYMSKYLEQVLKVYENDIIFHQFAPNFNFTLNTYYLGKGKAGMSYHMREDFKAAEILARAAFLDCISKNYKRVEYLLLIDTDEMAIPRTDTKYISLLNNLIKESKQYKYAASLSIDMAMFYKTFGNAGNETSHLHTIQHRKCIVADKEYELRSRMGRVKSFINPKSCVLPYHHHCLETVSNAPVYVHVPQNVALLHHYRDEVHWTDVALVPQDNDIMLNFKSELESSVRNTLRLVNYEI